ncbi:MAG: hypothetical protein RLZZ337_1400 [Bacteroidota bacterium]
MLFLALLFSACGGRKKAQGIDLNKQIVDQYWQSQFDFDCLELRGKATVTAQGKSNNVSLHIKMKQDSILWGKFSLLGFEIAKVMITADSFFLINSFSNEYMMYDNNYLYSYLGFKANLGQLQNILVGNAPFDSALYQLNAENVRLTANEGIATNNLILNDKFRTLSSNVTTPDTTQSADIQYDEYDLVNTKLMPKIVNISVKNATSPLDVVLNYQIVNTSPITTFPCNIPNGYKRR